MADGNCYEILGLARRADVAEVKSAYRALSKRHHPDLGGDASLQARLNLAKEVLCDPVRRAAHDEELRRTDPAFFRDEADDRDEPAAGREEAPAEGPIEKPAAPVRRPGPSPRGRRDGLKRNVESSIEALRDRLRSDLAAKKEETAERMRGKRRQRLVLRAGAICGAAASVIACAAFRSPVPLLAAGACAYPFLASLRLSLDGFEYSPYDLKGNALAPALERYAEFQACRAINEKLAVWEKARKHFEPGEFRFSATLPETEMAVRLLLGFFGIGYVPRGCEPSSRTLSFDDPGGIVLVRYRHREGRPTGIRYVRDAAAEAEGASALSGRPVSKVFLFSTAGFSRNAEAECRARGIAFYGAEDFKDWLDGLRLGGFYGPREDVFGALAAFDRVMGELRGASASSPQRTRGAAKVRGRLRTPAAFGRRPR